MSRFAYKTIGNEYPQGKPRVFFACHPGDLGGFLETYAQKILRIHTCAIWYESEYDEDYDREELTAQLSLMQLIVMPVTTKLLTSPNRAMDVEFVIAQEKHIPVLPIMLEEGITDVFTKRFGNLQYIDPNQQDPAKCSSYEVLETYIRAVLAGDETAKKVRDAFKASIFLSCRKKDRAMAQKLMRLIHKSTGCQDIAIWHDEFLTPGEDFSDLSRAMLEKSDAFALTVTPNLVNEINNVMTMEYPAARRSGKAILAVEMEKTDRDKLAESYEGIPDLIDGDDENALLSAVQKKLQTVAASENDSDPAHRFLIGLAYLNGINVEVDDERAVMLIRSAAEADVPEAMEQLAIMYETGKGVTRDYHEGVSWRRKYVDCLRAMYEEKPCKDSLNHYFYGLRDLGDALYALHLLDEANTAYQMMLEISAKGRNDEQLRRCRSVGYEKLGNIAETQSRPEEAKKFYERAQKIRLALAQDPGTVEFRRDLAIGYNKMGKKAEEKGRLENAKGYYTKGLEISLALAEETGTVESRRDLTFSYTNLGSIAMQQGRPEEAQAYYEKVLEICLTLVEDTGTVESCRDLTVSYEMLGNLARAQGRLEEAKEQYKKSLEICFALAVETGTVWARRDLSVNYDSLGNIAEAQDKPEEAQEYYEKEMEILLALAKETGMVGARRDLAISYEKLGSIAKAQESLEEAKKYYKKGLEIRCALAEETGTVESRHDLAVSYNNLGNIAEAQGRIKEAKTYYEKCLESRLVLIKVSKTRNDILLLQAGYYTLAVFLYEKTTEKKRADEMFQAAIGIGRKSEYPEVKKHTEAIRKKYRERYYFLDIPEPTKRKGAYRGIREILIHAAKSNPYASKVFCSPDIPEKLAKRAAESYSQQINWRDIIVLEEYPAFLRRSKTVIYTDTILDSDWMDNDVIIEHNSIIKLEKIGNTKIKFWFEPAGDLIVDFGGARDSVFYMVSQIVEKTW